MSCKVRSSIDTCMHCRVLGLSICKGEHWAIGNLIFFRSICKVVSDDTNPRGHAGTLILQRIQLRGVKKFGRGYNEKVCVRTSSAGIQALCTYKDEGNKASPELSVLKKTAAVRKIARYC